MVLQVMPAGIPFGASGYTINNAIWLDGTADYLSRTPSGDGNLKTWTLNLWIKGPFNSACHILNADAGVGSDLETIQFTSDTLQLYWDTGTLNFSITTSQVFRDDTAWGMLTVAFDTTQSTSSDRVKIYWNGVQITDFSSATYPALNGSCQSINKGSVAHNLFRYVGASNYFEGYAAEVAFIDGTALDASSFGETDANGNWVPIDLSGLTYGTNGYLLDFAIAPGTGNGSGEDVSGNGNHFTENSMTAAQQVTDTPTDDAANDVGNYAVINPLNKRLSGGGYVASNTLSEGNLKTASDTASSFQALTQTLAPGGKYHLEITTGSWGADSATSQAVFILTPLSLWLTGTTAPSVETASYSLAAKKSGSSGFGTISRFAGSNKTTLAVDIADGDRISFDIDMSTIGSSSVTIKVNGTTRATDTAMAFQDEPYVIAFDVDTAARSTELTFNTGQSSFGDTPAAGHVGIATQNLSAPTVTDPSAYFQSVLYTGNGTAIGSGGNAITLGGNATMQPDFVWIKNRDAADEHMVYDAVRGATKDLNSDSTSAEATDTEGLSTFDSDGFTVGSNVAVNTNTEKYVAWCMKAGGSGSSNSDGSITSTVSVADHGGFSVGTYTGTGSNATVGHGLSRAPTLMWVKRTDSVDGWMTQDPINLGGGYLELHGTNGYTADSTAWNSTDPTASVFSLGTANFTNINTGTFHFSCFARTPGLIGIGSYTGNGNADGPYVVVDDGASGFRPAFLLIKRIGGTTTNASWYLYDATRSPYNEVGLKLAADTTQIETDLNGANEVDFTANGFKLRSATANSGTNLSGETHIYLAFAEFPFGGDGVAQARAR